MPRIFQLIGHLNCSGSRFGQKVLFSVFEESYITITGAVLTKPEKNIDVVEVEKWDSYNKNKNREIQWTGF